MTAMLNLAAMTGFASDNNASVHPAVLAALTSVNDGHVVAYGDDRYTKRCNAQFEQLFGRSVEVLLVWGGTGANVVALGSLLQASQAVICSRHAHINVDEGGAPERIIGTKLIDVASDDGKITPEQVAGELHAIGNPHHAQPKVVSITQSTELGAVYQPSEIAAISEVAHAHGLLVHMDGARIANATASLRCDIRDITVGAGVDVVSFGGTKNGMMYGEAVVFLTPGLAGSAQYIRKQFTQLPSKARYIAAQFEALLTDGLWLQTAGHANAMAQRLHVGITGVAGIDPGPAPQANALFPRLPRRAIIELQRAWRFYDWDVHTHQVRWMTSWDTTVETVDAFLADVRSIATVGAIAID